MEIRVEVALVEEVDLVLRLVHALPADFPGELEVVLRIHPGEQALAHVGLDAGSAPDVAHVVLVLAEAGGVADAVVRGRGGFDGVCQLCCRCFILIPEDAGHAAHHVVEDVAVKHPVVRFIGLKLDGARAHRRHIDRVLER